MSQPPDLTVVAPSTWQLAPAMPQAAAERLDLRSNLGRAFTQPVTIQNEQRTPWGRYATLSWAYAIGDRGEPLIATARYVKTPAGVAYLGDLRGARPSPPSRVRRGAFPRRRQPQACAPDCAFSPAAHGLDPAPVLIAPGLTVRAAGQQTRFHVITKGNLYPPAPYAYVIAPPGDSHRPLEASTTEEMQAMLDAARFLTALARAAGLAGLDVWANSGAAALQTLPHMHLQVRGVLPQLEDGLPAGCDPWETALAEDSTYLITTLDINGTRALLCQDPRGSALTLLIPDRQALDEITEIGDLAEPILAVERYLATPRAGLRPAVTAHNLVIAQPRFGDRDRTLGVRFIPRDHPLSAANVAGFELAHDLQSRFGTLDPIACAADARDYFRNERRGGED